MLNTVSSANLTQAALTEFRQVKQRAIFLVPDRFANTCVSLFQLNSGHINLIDSSAPEIEFLHLFFFFSTSVFYANTDHTVPKLITLYRCRDDV